MYTCKVFHLRQVPTWLLLNTGIVCQHLVILNEPASQRYILECQAPFKKSCITETQYANARHMTSSFNWLLPYINWPQLCVAEKYIKYRKCIKLPKIVCIAIWPSTLLMQMQLRTFVVKPCCKFFNRNIVAQISHDHQTLRQRLTHWQSIKRPLKIFTTDTSSRNRKPLPTQFP